MDNVEVKIGQDQKLVKQEQGSSDEFESDSEPPDPEELARDAKRNTSKSATIPMNYYELQEMI